MAARVIKLKLISREAISLDVKRCFSSSLTDCLSLFLPLISRASSDTSATTVMQTLTPTNVSHEKRSDVWPPVSLATTGVSPQSQRMAKRFLFWSQSVHQTIFPSLQVELLHSKIYFVKGSGFGIRLPEA